MLDRAAFADDERRGVGRYLGFYTHKNAVIAQNSFAAFRKTIRPGMLWNPFVARITRELQRFGEAYEAGERRKLAFCTPPQHQFGKNTAAEDFAAWMAGRILVTRKRLRISRHLEDPHLRSRRQQSAAQRARHRDGVPELRALSAHDRCSQYGFLHAAARRGRAEIAERVNRAAEILGLTPYLDRYPRQLSGGQRQRVAMGRASCAIRKCSCSTSRCPISTPSCGYICERR
jgi:ABC-type sugar transport system ATPase subunit